MPESLRDRVVAAIGDQYALEDEIGRGGMSVVYRARDLRLNRRVAIKVLPPELAYDPAIRLRFTREAQTSAQLAHAHVVPIYDVGDRDGIAYFVMAHVGGGNLARLLAHEPRQPVDEVRRILTEIADALAYAHAHGVIHRDVKPDNILLDADTGRALVTDFGIARAIESGSRLTVTGIAVGTPTYMSPEQAQGDRRLDGRSDVYSLGVIGYQMLTGRVPFTASNSMALLMKHVSERPLPIADLRPDTPRALREVVERALMKAPEDRWPAADAMRDALASGDVPVAAWRTDAREPVRYTTPRPESRRARTRDRSAEPARADSPRRGSLVVDGRTGQPALMDATGAVVLEPGHLAALTPEQRRDLRLWHGRVGLLDRVKATRWYTLATVVMTVAGTIATIAGLAEGIPPAILIPIVPIYMCRKLWRRFASLRASGLRIWRVLLMPRARWVLPKAPQPTGAQLARLAPRAVLESAAGAAIRRAAEDREAIRSIVASLAPEDRALLPDLSPTVDALVERVAHVAGLMHQTEGVDPRLLGDLPTRLSRQLDSALLALGTLRVDLIKVRSSGVQAALSDVSNATQEARALSREIGAMLHAAGELRDLR